jgi:hypothetical protein
VNLTTTIARWKKAGAGILLALAVAGCTTVDRKPWIGTWSRGDGFNVTSIALSDNGKGLVGSGMGTLPVEWQERSGIAYLRFLDQHDMPEELRQILITARLLDGGSTLEISGMTMDGTKAPRVERLALQSCEDPADAIAEWQKVLRAEVEPKRGAQQNAHEKTVYNDFDDRNELLSVIQHTLEREKESVTFAACDSNGWQRLRVERKSDQISLKFVEARSGSERGVSFNSIGISWEDTPRSPASFVPVCGERVAALVREQRKNAAAKIDTEYVTWVQAPDYAERHVKIAWSGQKTANGPWMQLLEEILPPNPVHLRLQTIIWR